MDVAGSRAGSWHNGPLSKSQENPGLQHPPQASTVPLSALPRPRPLPLSLLCARTSCSTFPRWCKPPRRAFITHALFRAPFSLLFVLESFSTPRAEEGERGAHPLGGLSCYLLFSYLSYGSGRGGGYDRTVCQTSFRVQAPTLPLSPALWEPRSAPCTSPRSLGGCPPTTRAS